MPNAPVSTQPLVPPPEGGRYLGFLFARSDSPDRVERALREAHGRLGLRIDPDPTAGAGDDEGSLLSC